VKPPKILLEAWGEARWDPPLTPWQLRKMARDGVIFPPPEKRGRSWYVEPTAYCLDTESRAPLLDRIKAEA